MIKISVVIPVYKAENFLHELYKRLKDSLEKITEDFEIIMVDDASDDRSWDIIADLNTKDRRMKGINFTRNFGQHYAITAGLEHCCGDWVVVMDCDLQDKPEEIIRLYAKAQEGYDVVLGIRRRRKDSIAKRIASYMFFKIFSYLSEVNHDWQVGNFRIVSRRVADNFCRMHERLRFFGGLISWMGYPTLSIEVEHEESRRGRSSYTFKKLLKLATDIIIAYSDKPLRLSVQFGFLIAVLSFVLGSHIFLRALFSGTPVPGWSSLMVSLFFIGGIIIFNLGIIGIYLGKTFDEVKKRPMYLIKEKIGIT